VLAVLREELDAAVRPVAHEETSLRIHREGVRVAELPVLATGGAPLHEVIALGVELHDPVVVVRTVPVRDEDAAVGRDQDIGGPVERPFPVADHPDRPERHQEFARRTELEDDVAPAFLRRPRADVRRVGDPDVALAVDEHPVRPEHLPRAEALEDVPLEVELQNRIEVREGAGVLPASVPDPDRLSVG